MSDGTHCAGLRRALRRRFRWSVTGREQLPVFFTCRDVEGGDAFLDVESKRVAEELANHLLATPGEWISSARRRRRHEWPHHLEHLAQAAVRRPVREGDPATGYNDARQFMRRRCVIGREHDPASRGQSVIGSVIEVEALAVTNPVVDLEFLFLRPLPRRFD
jgi:hypothetical protein